MMISMLRACVLPMLLLLPLVSLAASEHPVRVTTDSAAYCEVLAERLAARPKAAAGEVRSLAEEGQRLCETGHVRTGIAKLRRALRATQANGG
jgi:hypothetical protein